MNSKSIGADLVYAWNDAKVGMMDADLAVKIMYPDAKADELSKKAAEYEKLQSTAEAAARRGYLDRLKKKLALILSLCFILLTLGACGTDPKDVDYNGVSYNQLQDYSANLISSLTGYSSSDLDSLLSDSSSLDEKTSNMVQKWKETVADIGDYQGTGEFSVDKSGNTLTTDQILHFEKRDVDFQVVINYTDMSITGYSVEPVYSLGEKMEKAGMNTVISMCVVFAVLILISLIIYAFKIFPYLEKKKQEKSEPSVAKDPVVTQIEQKEEQQLADDNELVAVFADAIAASTGTSTSDFVVRSINRR